MTDNYILFGGGVSRDVIVRMVLAEGDIPYELQSVDILAGEHRSEAFRKLNPGGYTPALITPEGETLFETAGMMLYLLERHDMTQFLPMPGDPDRGQFLSLLFYHTSEIQPSFKRWFYPHRFTTDSAAGRDKIMGAAYEILLDRWGLLDARLRKEGPFHLGERFSVLDMHMAMWATYGLRSSDEIFERFPDVARVTEVVRARPKSGPILIQQRADMQAWRDSTECMTTKTGTY